VRGAMNLGKLAEHGGGAMVVGNPYFLWLSFLSFLFSSPLFGVWNQQPI
jgi:hypothetical protein